ncbi:MAG: hypothetical protein WBL23_16045 [Salinisphaera sp.]
MAAAFWIGSGMILLPAIRFLAVAHALAATRSVAPSARIIAGSPRIICGPRSRSAPC